MVFDSLLIREEILSPRDFLELSREDRAAIKRVKVIPPKLGRKGYGRIAVEYDSPRYVVAHGLRLAKKRA